MKKVYKPSYWGYCWSFLLMILVLIAAGLTQYVKAGASWLKWAWIAAVVVDVLILIYIWLSRSTMSLILRDYPDDPANQEVAFIRYNFLKPGSSNFRRSIEIGLRDIVHIEVTQTALQVLLGIGEVIITSSGTGGEEIHASNISHPSAVRDEIQTHSETYKKQA